MTHEIEFIVSIYVERNGSPCLPAKVGLFGQGCPYSSSVFLRVNLDRGLPRAPAAPGQACPAVAKSSCGCPRSFMCEDETHPVLLERRFWQLSVGVLHPRRRSRHGCRAMAWAERCLSSREGSVQPQALTPAIYVQSDLKHEIRVAKENIRLTRNATVSPSSRATGS